jgi:hypothetical protein
MGDSDRKIRTACSMAYAAIAAFEAPESPEVIQVLVTAIDHRQNSYLGATSAGFSGVSHTLHLVSCVRWSEFWPCTFLSYPTGAAAQTGHTCLCPGFACMCWGDYSCCHSKVSPSISGGLVDADNCSQSLPLQSRDRCSVWRCLWTSWQTTTCCRCCPCVTATKYC